MELLEKLADKLVAGGPWGILSAVLLGVIVMMGYAMRRLYLDNQAMQKSQSDHQDSNLEDAKEYARGLSAGLATLDAVKELTKELFANIAANRNKR